MVPPGQQGNLTAGTRTEDNHELGYADYFLMVWDIGRYARRNKIRFAGRGSAADSAVAYCLNITEVDSIARGLLFERFLSPERAQCPDIDLDIDSRFRDRVAAYVENKYGAEYTAHVCTYNTFKARSAWRDLGKALGFPLEELDSIGKILPHVHADYIRQAAESLPELRKALYSPRYSQLLDLCEQVAGFPGSSAPTREEWWSAANPGRYSPCSLPPKG